MISLIPDNTDLLKFASTLRVDLEFLIYTIETHRSRTGNRFAKARVRFTDALIQFLNDATVLHPCIYGSAIADSGQVAKISTSNAVGSPGTAPNTNALLGVRQTESRSHIDSRKEGKGPVLLPVDTPSSEVADIDQLKASRNCSSSEKTAPSGHLPAREQATVTKATQAKTTPSDMENNPKQLERNRTIWIRDLPSAISRTAILAQVCGGAIEGIQLSPHRHNNHCDVSITFVLPSAAKAYLKYVHTPHGRLIFPGFPNHWEFCVRWHPNPQRMNPTVTRMAQDPNIRARRCLIIKNFPTETVGIDMLRLKLSKLKGNLSQHIEVQKILVDNKCREATIIMDNISCALQVMQSKFRGELGKEFDGCSFEYGKDDCDRPIPGSLEGAPFTTGKRTASDTTLPKTRNYGQPGTQRTLYIPELPSTATIPELVSQLCGGPLERVILVKHKKDEGLSGCVTFVHQSSTITCYKHLTSPGGRLKFPGVVWDWPVNLDNHQGPIRAELLEQIMDPAVNARRGFVIKNFPSQKVLVETLKTDVLSQSQQILSFERFEVNRTKHEGKVIMATIGAAVGAIKFLKRLQRYQGCTFEYLRDVCEDPILTVKDCIGKPKNATSKPPKDLDDVIDVITQSNNSPATLIIGDLPDSITLSELSARIRGGALDSLQIHTHTHVGQKTTASITFLDSSAAQRYFGYMMSSLPSRKISWKPRDVSSVVSYSRKGEARRVLMIKGFPSEFTKARTISEIEKVVKHATRKLKMNQKHIIESISVRGDERKEARVVMASIKLAILTKGELPRSWKAGFGWDSCEGDLTQLRLV